MTDHLARPFVILAAGDDELHFVALNALWRSDGTPEGTVLVFDILAGPGGSSPHQLTNVNGSLYFIAASTNGLELQIWRRDPQGALAAISAPTSKSSV